MKSKSALLLLVIITSGTFLFGMQSDAQKKKRKYIRDGQDIDEAVKVMSKIGAVTRTPLAIAIDARDKLALKTWPVGGGYLVAAYSTINNRIVSMTAYLSGGTRREEDRKVTFRVKAYAPDTGEMWMIVPNKSIQQIAEPRQTQKQ